MSASGLKLRDYQAECIDIIDNLDGGAHPISQAPQVPLLVCGFARTATGSHQRIYRELQGRPVRLHRKAQTRSRIESLIATSVIYGHSRTMSANTPKMSENAPRCPQLLTVRRKYRKHITAYR